MVWLNWVCLWLTRSFPWPSLTEGEILVFQILRKKLFQGDEFQEVRGSWEYLSFLANNFFHTHPKGRSLIRKSKDQTGSLCPAEAPTSRSIPQVTSALRKSSNWWGIITKNMGQTDKTRPGALTWRNLNLIGFMKPYFLAFYHKVPQHMSWSWITYPTNIYQIFTCQAVFLALGKISVLQAPSLPAQSWRHGESATDAKEISRIISGSDECYGKSKAG